MMSGERASSVLIVDDGAGKRKRWRAACESAGFGVVETENCLEALTLLRAGPRIDLLVTSAIYDDAGAQLVAEAGERAIPLIIVAGYAYPVGMQSGYAVLLEPVSDAELIGAARALLSQ